MELITKLEAAIQSEDYSTMKELNETIKNNMMEIFREFELKMNYEKIHQDKINIVNDKHYILIPTYIVDYEDWTRTTYIPILGQLNN